MQILLSVPSNFVPQFAKLERKKYGVKFAELDEKLELAEIEGSEI